MSLAKLGVRFATLDKVFFSLLIIYLEGSGNFFQVGVDLPPFSISKNPRWPPIMKKPLRLVFEFDVLRLTKGQGVNVVLNSLTEEKLQALVRLFSKHARFLEIGKFDLANNSSLGK